jgi:hypothetical protein
LVQVEAEAVESRILHQVVAPEAGAVEAAGKAAHPTQALLQVALVVAAAEVALKLRVVMGAMALSSCATVRLTAHHHL